MKYLGLTGHHDPAILLEAMRRFDFDTVLIALNAADTHRLSFARTVLAEAARRGMGVIGMKVYAAGVLLRGGATRLPRPKPWVMSLPARRLDRYHRLLEPAGSRRKRPQRPDVSSISTSPRCAHSKRRPSCARRFSRLTSGRHRSFVHDNAAAVSLGFRPK